MSARISGVDPMLSAKMQNAMNDQINAETFSAYLYLSMVAYFDDLNLSGMAQWMRVQVQEEMTHAMKFFDHMNERGGRVILEAIEKPQAEWDSPLAAFEAALAHEQYITSRINSLVGLAGEENDRASDIFLQWFVTEQVEEEANADDIVRKLKMFGAAPQALYMIDKDLGARVFVPPASAGAA